MIGLRDRKVIHYLWLLPTISATAWFCTLFPLLVVWLADGRPTYPKQSNPYVAFISDIGAFRLKPLFVIGSIITSVTYIGTFVSIRHARHNPRMYGLRDPAYKQIISIIAVLAALLAGISLILLSCFDTFRFHYMHSQLLLSCFIGIAISALSSVALYVDWPGSKQRFDGVAVRTFVRWRPFCTVSILLVAVEVVLSIAFWVMQWTNHFRAAGILEWVVTFTGVFYIASLVGFVAYVSIPLGFGAFIMGLLTGRYRRIPTKESGDGERAPLLAPVNSTH